MPKPRTDHGIEERRHPHEAVNLPHCRWCGVPTDGAALYCKRAHQKYQNQRRRDHEMKPIKPCPHPEKRPLPHRGTAILWARYQTSNYYLCQCGVYHLTNKAARNNGMGPFSPAPDTSEKETSRSTAPTNEPSGCR